MHIKKLPNGKLAFLNTDIVGYLNMASVDKGVPAVQTLVVPRNQERRYTQLSDTPDTLLPFGTAWPQLHEFMVYVWLQLVDLNPGFFYAVSGEWYGGTGAYHQGLKFRCLWSFSYKESQDLLRDANKILKESVYHQDFRDIRDMLVYPVRFEFQQDEEESWSLEVGCQGPWYSQAHLEMQALGEDCDIRQAYDQEPYSFVKDRT